MSPREYALSVKRAWKLITACVLLGVVAGAVMSGVMPAKYVSTTRFFVASAVDSEDPDELFNRNQIAGQRVKSYVELILSDAVSTAVVEELGSDDLGLDADDDVAATALPETVIIDVQVTGATPEAAQRIAEAYAAVAPGVVGDVESVGTVKAAQVALSEIQTPRLGKRETPSLAHGLLFGGLLGLVLGVGGVVLWGAVRRETRTDRVEEQPTLSAP